MTKAARGVQDLDPFRARQFKDVATRLREERDRHDKAADLMWMGALTSGFSDHELRLLDDMGFLSQHDRDLIRQARRGLGA